MSIVLMYHAIENRRDVKGFDPHYAVSMFQFEQHVQNLMQKDYSITSLQSLLSDTDDKQRRNVYFTFDDGHISNYRAGLFLSNFGFTGDFFINPELVGSDHLMDWKQINELSNSGQSIQSHGLSHAYFDSMSKTEIRRDLETSKKIIEDKIGKAVDIFAPPGGRITREVRNIAREVGYKMICDSIPGVIGGNLYSIPRLPVKHNFSLDILDGYLKENGMVFFKDRAKYYFLFGFKKLLGNHSYDIVRSRLIKIIK